MAQDTTATARGSCLECGFEAPAGSDDWSAAEHPSLGSLTACPDCGSTNVTSRER